jgi:flagellar hook protein FlgE
MYYTQSTNSGTPQYTYPGSGTTGSLVSGGLEMSNVDLTKEFTDMIVTQRGFQANSRVITTSDQVLEELVNLKR